jgi:hypothetical protein
MGQRVSFATTQWKDKPGKPSCYTQAQWDARNSSKFNGAPFASPFAVEPQGDTGTVETYTREDVEAFRTALAATGNNCVSDCSGNGVCIVQMGLYGLELPKKVSVTVPCSLLDMKVWDGSTYFDMTGLEKDFSWQGCYYGEALPGRTYFLKYGIRTAKYPSASADYYIPVCGPGTHIQEITRQQMVDLVWRIATFDIDASGISYTSNLTADYTVLNYPGYDDECTDTFSSTSSVNIGTYNKNKNPDHPTPQNESNLVNLNWQSNPETGYKANYFKYFDSSGDLYENGTGEGNVIPSVSRSGGYSCLGASGSWTFGVGAGGAINITIKENLQREKFIYFVKDSQGVERIYLDVTGLFNFQLPEHRLDPGNVLAPHSIQVNFLGKTWQIGVYGLDNKQSTNYSWGSYEEYGGLESRSLNYSSDYGSQAFQGSRNFASGGSITITPKKYYPYANSSGDPVYNVDSGAQLVDPLS